MYFNFPQKDDGLGGYNFVTKHHSKASNFVTPQKGPKHEKKSYFFDTILLFKILDEYFM